MSTTLPAHPLIQFWRRQFEPGATAAQDCLDFAGGFLLPLVCLSLDPIVFRSSVMGKPILGSHLFVAGAAIAIGFVSLLVWLVTRKPSAFLAGMLSGSALFAFLLGLLLLPFSIIGLFLFIGVFGFTPFLTAFVFWRNSYRARPTHESTNKTNRIAAIVGFVFAFCGPIVGDLYINDEFSHAIEMVASADPAVSNQGSATLRMIRSIGCIDADRLVVAYNLERDEARRIRLAQAYQDVTGSDIEIRRARLQALADD